MNVQLDLFNVIPEWLVYLRTRPEFEDAYKDKDIPRSFWTPAGLYRWHGLAQGSDVGVNVGHWITHGEFDRTEWHVLLLFEDGNVEAFGPHMVFPAKKQPAWWKEYRR